MGKFTILQNERDEFEDKYLKFQSAQKDTVSKDEYTKNRSKNWMAKKMRVKL